MSLNKKRKYNRQPNLITRSSDQMNVIEKRLLYLVINKMETRINIQEDLFKNIEFQIPFKDTGETNYTRIKEAVEKLQTRKINLIDDVKEKRLTSIVPFPYVKIEKGVITLKMLGDVIPYFVELKNGFTQYELEAALALTSVYSQKLYELLSRWKDLKTWEVGLEELKLILSAENYTRFADFRRNCIDGPLEEIADKTELLATYLPLKEGRKVVGLKFNIKTKKDVSKEAHQEGMEQFVELTSAEKNHYIYSLVREYTFSKQQIDKIMASPTLFNKFVDLDSKINNGLIKNVKNRTAYVAKSLFT
jgi:plasmid replication initiation protein